MSRKNLVILLSVGLLVVAVVIFGGIMNSALDTVVLAPGAPGVHYDTEEYL